MSNLQSEYLVFVDESGSHTMGNIDPQYPLFVLAFFIVKKSDYVAHITPAVQRLTGSASHFFHHKLAVVASLNEPDTNCFPRRPPRRDHSR